MTTEIAIKDKILEAFNQKEVFQGIELDQDFFDMGISSLTVVELQIRVEEVLGVQLPTAELMRLSTINSWVDAYTAKAAEA